MRVVVLGTDALTIDAPREGAGSTVEQLLASSPDAAVIAASGEPAFFRASVALERAVSRVIVRSGSMPDAWMAELAARASVLGGEVFTRDDDRYLRLRAGARTEFVAPSFEDFVPPGRGEPMKRTAEDSSVRCEELAFELGLKAVLYLVVPKSTVVELAAKHGDIVVRGDRLASTHGSGERTYGVGDEVAHVFIGVGAGRAAELWADDSTRNVEELGALMGYPPCCVRAFAAMANRRANAAFPYVTAARTRALGERFVALLDGTTTRLVPFVPCTYGCARALEWAAAVARAASIERRARPVLYLDESCAIAFAEATHDGATVTYRDPSWAVAANDTLQRAYGAIFGESGSIELRDRYVVVNGTPLPRGVFLPFVS